MLFGSVLFVSERKWLCFSFLLLFLRFEASLTYAPNFITKIIQEQTGRTPVGLLGDGGDDGDSAKQHNSDDGSKTVHDSFHKEKEVMDRIVTTRFPPEPNGYLHLGHAKAICFNFAVARMFGGVCHMRLDDTNPSKEEREYVDSILQDVRWVLYGTSENDGDPWEGAVRKTSDYFDLIHQCAVALIKQGSAYVDSLSAEEMREYRGTLTEPGKESPFRNRSVEENLELFEKMKAGEFEEGASILRAKIDMASPNINMRDPALYRIKHESHQETGEKWCIYPMYDFSHPIADAVENITHSLCTLEFEDHRPFYDWTIEKLLPTGLITSRPQQIEFSRLNVKSTVLSKRKLIQLVQQGHVNGWDDPRMPTLSGMRRRGIPPSALRLFCQRVGISKADSNIDLSVLEDCIREDMDATCPRAFCVLKPLKVIITNWEKDDAELDDFTVPRHPKIGSMGERTIPFGPEFFIERTDFFDIEGPEGNAVGNKPPKGFKRLLPNGGRVRLRFAYVIQCNNVIRDEVTQEPTALECTFISETRAGRTPELMDRVPGIIHWVEASTGVRVQIYQYDRLFVTEEPGKDSGDFLLDLNPRSLEILSNVVLEPSAAQEARSVIESHVKKCFSSEAFQFERCGYFALDQSSTAEELIFNRVVTLRDTWGIPNKNKEPAKRNRGKNRKRGGEQQANKKDSNLVEDVCRVAFRAVQILHAENHPQADNLLVCQVDCGEEQPRTIVAGLSGKLPIDQLVGQKVVAVTNLKPAKMRGIESTAMLLAATASSDEQQKEIVALLNVPDSVPPGELISLEKKPTSEPDEMLKSKGALKVWDRVKSCLRSNTNGEATYVNEDRAHRMMTSAGPVITSVVGATIQ